MTRPLFDEKGFRPKLTQPFLAALTPEEIDAGVDLTDFLAQRPASWPDPDQHWMGFADPDAEPFDLNAPAIGQDLSGFDPGDDT